MPHRWWDRHAKQKGEYSQCPYCLSNKAQKISSDGTDNEYRCLSCGKKYTREKKG